MTQPARAQTATPEFKAWFKASKVVDASGQPLVVYHGTNSDFSSFDPDAFGKSDPGYLGVGFYFGPKYAANSYSSREGGSVMSVYLSLQNPHEITPDNWQNPDGGYQRVAKLTAEADGDRLKGAQAYRAELETAGYDGVIDRAAGPIEQVVAFSANQIKSATGNSGAFSPDSDSVTEAEADVDARVSAIKQIDSAAFKKWFGASGVTDDAGQPLKFYHGTQTPQDLTNFTPGGTVGSKQSGDAYGVGSYFTTSPSEASHYAKDDGAVLPVYLRGHLLDLDVEQLPTDQQQSLTQFAGEQLLPSDKARFSMGRKTREFDDVQDARDFFANQRANWDTFGDGMDRARPEADAKDGKFYVEYTDFDGPVDIKTGKDAETLFKAVGWDNIGAAGFDGLIMQRSGGQKWVVMFDPDGNVKSATGNSGAFDPLSPNITESTVTAYHGTRNGGFDDFKANYRKGEQLGFGIHFAADHDFAAKYAHDDQVARKGKAPMVYTVQLQMDNPLKADAIVRDGTPEFALAKQLAGSKLYVSKDEDGTPCCYMQNAIDATGGQRAEKLIRAAGFDSVVYQAKVGARVIGGMQVSGKSESYIVFEPSQIKIVSKESITEDVAYEEQELADLQAQLDVATAALKVDQSGTNMRLVQRLRQQIGDAQERVKAAKADETPASADDDHRGEHRPPGPDDGAPAFDLTQNGIYPADFYGPRGAAEYGQGNDELGRRVQALHNRPDHMVWIYRALPPGVPTTTHTAFRPGDWVTISKSYAQEHGDSNLDAGFKIARMRCRTCEIFTNGDSLEEWGYWPQAQTESIDQQVAADIAKAAKLEFMGGGSVEWKVIEQEEDDEEAFTARFEIDGATVEVSCEDIVGAWAVQFYQMLPDEHGRLRQHLKLVPTKSRFKLLSTVVEILGHFVDEYQPEMVLFDANDEDKGRADLYRRMLARFVAKYPDYSVREDRKSDATEFIVRRGATTESKAQEQTPEFKAWFGTSVAVDATGSPRVYYHGTLNDFDEFKSKDGAFYFSTDPKTAAGAERGFLDPDDFKDLGLPPEAFATPDGLRVVPCYLRVSNPASEDDVKLLMPNAATIRAAVPALRAAGFDGFMNDYEMIVFSSTNIKSATANSGAFNPISSNIMEAFDSGLTYEVIERTPKLFRALFTTPAGKELYVEAESFGSKWLVSFGLVEGGLDEWSMTNDRAALTVLATIVNVLSEFVAEYQPAELTFPASKDDRSRVSVYKRLLARKLPGYTVKTKSYGPRADQFVLTKAEPVAEAFVATGKTDYDAGVVSALLQFGGFGPYVWDGKTLALADGTKLGMLKLRVDGNRLIIDDIEIDRKGQGAGTAAIRAIVDHAHLCGLTPALFTDAMRGKQQQKNLRSYYERLGFVRNSGVNKVKGMKEEYYFPLASAVSEDVTARIRALTS